MHIELKDEVKPVRQRLRRLGPKQMKALREEVKKLLKAGFISPVETAEWVSPVVVTPKKDGKWRICVDFKPLNAATKKDPYPLPLIKSWIQWWRVMRGTVCVMVFLAIFN